MSLGKYRPLPFEGFKDLTSYEQLKELCSRGSYWFDEEKNVHSQQEIFQEFGNDIFKRLFCQEFDSSLCDVFEFSKNIDYETRLLRNCGRSVAIHSLRSAKQVKDCNGSLRAQKYALGHDIIENVWNSYIILNNLRQFDSRNFQSVYSVRMNFIEFDITKIDLKEMRAKCDYLPLEIIQKFDEETLEGFSELSNTHSIDEKLAGIDVKKIDGLLANVTHVAISKPDEPKPDYEMVLEKDLVDLLGKDYNDGEKNLDYINVLIRKALANPDEEKYVDMIVARSGDRIDNLITMMYISPEDQLRFVDKTLIHLVGSLNILQRKEARREISLDDSLFKITHHLAKIAQMEVFRIMNYHAIPAHEGYKHEYKIAHFADQFEDRSDKLDKIWKKLETRYRIGACIKSAEELQESIKNINCFSEAEVNAAEVNTTEENITEENKSELNKQLILKTEFKRMEQNFFINGICDLVPMGIKSKKKNNPDQLAIAFQF